MRPANPNRFKRLNQPPKGEGWIWFTHDMLVSDAWRDLSPAATAVLQRLSVEHMNHAGTQNGRLICTYDDFEGFGIRRRSIPGALAELKLRGIIRVTGQGRRSSGQTRHPNLYALTWLPSCDGEMATNEWKRYRSSDKIDKAHPSKIYKAGAKTPPDSSILKIPPKRL
jgi:hypothetical protein